MEVDRVIPSQFVYPSSKTGEFVPAGLDQAEGFYHGPPAAAAAAGAAAETAADPLPPMPEFVYPSSVEVGSPPPPTPPYDLGGPWAQKRIIVPPSPSSSERMHMYGAVPPRSWADAAKEFLGSFMESLQDRQQQLQQLQQQQQQQQRQVQQQQQMLYTRGNHPHSGIEGFVVDAPPQLVYNHVVYVPHHTLPPAAAAAAAAVELKRQPYVNISTIAAAPPPVQQ
ncbi:LOW QUALITY PROTEIN: uncharacterized protein EMH_0042980 [Eimeria mitis]|uniref:Uncharacterized protein n=1 Tax=Eimeria mitis TaxID=44415 RepID=U6JX93_9EIME|nr:LOW QUALITY PROTEIN: uncharacterized protein EMH_0042980 [Eimeria mitis]CDJ28677.1 hypothetical protein, conserved [Eimeria mitis]